MIGTLLFSLIGSESYLDLGEKLLRMEKVPLWYQNDTHSWAGVHLHPEEWK